MPALLLLIFLMFSVFSISTLPALSISSNNVSHSQQQWLLGFKQGITLDPNNSLSKWNYHTPLCNWTGITCTPPTNSVLSVVSLDLSFMSLEGTISPLLGNLSSLQSLNLSNNALHGQIPPQLARLSRLQILRLHRNQLQGTIPPSLSDCRYLFDLELSFNQLHGSIPPELSLLSSLKYLYLGVNNLTGNIPPSLGNLSALTDVEFGENDLQGPIPAEFGFLNQLEVLFLFENKLSGTIPPSLTNLSELNELGLDRNQLSGHIPWEIGTKLTKLQILFLWRNQLSGDIPKSIGNLSHLTHIDFSENNLQGPIPAEFGFLNQLEVLSLFENKLSGTFPPSLTNLSELNELDLDRNQLSGHIPWEIGTKLTKLQILSLWGNQLSGDIPKSIGNCSNLTILSLDTNQLSGMVPTELGKLSLLKRLYLHDNQLVSGSSSTLPFLTALTNCSLLEQLEVSYNYLTGVLPLSIGRLSSKFSYLDLSYNYISGSIPQQIANLTNLTFLDLSNNLFSGNIPSEIKRFHKLERLYLSGNRLEGSIPTDIGQMKSLGLLTLSRNKLSGKIPGSLCSLPQLRYLCLDHNYLSGVIPASLEGCQNLELLDLSYNKLRGRIPRQVIGSLKNLQFYLNLSWNSLHGSLPGEISKIVMAQAIQISGNQLHGIIPNALGDCTALESLNLSHNAFEGPIPDALSKLKNLQEMDLSANLFSGSIPLSLRRLRELRYMNLSFNNFSGQIPEEGLFPNSTVIPLLMGNRGLCGPQNYSLPACPKQSQEKHSTIRKMVLSAVGIITFILCSLILGMAWRQKFSRRQIRPPNFIFERLRYPKYSYQDLVIATNGFDEANMLGVGNFGSVYRGNLTDGNVVAIKTLDLQNEEAHRSFNRECKVLGRIRHRNLTRIISAFWYPGLIGLVLQFASNGSLEKHLYPADRDEQDICELGLSELLKIAIDVAHGMEYLHHDCSPQVVHCDLKPGNVLLDSDMTALVTDFGISRLTTAPNSRDLPSTTTFALRGSIGYIAPEYGLGGSVSTEGDVYSYGILILEMVTRKRPSDEMFVGDMNLRQWVRAAFPERISDIVDKRLLRDVNENDNSEEIHMCLVCLINVGLICSSESPRERPSMRDVVRALESVRASFMGTATSSNLTSRISDFLRKTTPNPTGASTSDSKSSTR